MGGAGQVEERGIGGRGRTSGGERFRWEGLDKWRRVIQVGGGLNEVWINVFNLSHGR